MTISIKVFGEPSESNAMLEGDQAEADSNDWSGEESVRGVADRMSEDASAEELKSIVVNGSTKR
jgi:hypothetical protein